MKIDRAIIESLFSGNIRIENTFIMELITACDSMPESFWGVFDDNTEEVLKALGFSTNLSDYSEYGELLTSSELSEFLHDNKRTGVLIHFYVPVPSNFRFKDNGSFESCTQSWGMTTELFSYAETHEEALKLAISKASEYFEKCCEFEKSQVN